MMSKEQQISSSNDGWLFIKKQKKFKFPEGCKSPYQICPALNNTIALVGYRQFFHVDKDGTILANKKLKYGAFIAKMLCPYVLLLASKDHLCMFDLRNYQEIEMECQYKPLSNYDYGMFQSFESILVFQQMLFCVMIHVNAGRYQTQFQYYNGGSALKEGKLIPVHIGYISKNIYSLKISEGDKKSKICWYYEFQNFPKALHTYELKQGNKGVEKSYQLKGKIYDKLFQENSHLKIWESSPNILSVVAHFQNITYFKYDTINQKPKDIIQQICPKKQRHSLRKVFKHSQLPVTIFVTLQREKNAPFTIVNPARMNLYLFENTSNGRSFQEKLQLEENIYYRIVDHGTDMLCLSSTCSKSGIITLDLWNIISMKDVYVFFMAEDGMDLDEDLIWDAIRLLSQSE